MNDHASIETLHASGILTAAGVAAFCARSGTGKSTLASRLQQRGFTAWADDALAWAPFGDRAITFSQRFRLAPANEPSGQWQQPTEPQQPLAAIVVLERLGGVSGGGEVDVRSVSGAAALTSVLAHAHPCGAGNWDRRHAFVSRYLHLVATTPILRLRFRADPARLDAVCDAFVRLVAGELAG